MPYLKRETYLQWCKWVNEVCEKINILTASKRSYKLGVRYFPKRLVLLDDLYDNVVVAKGMKDITHFILMLQKRYEA